MRNLDRGDNTVRRMLPMVHMSRHLQKLGARIPESGIRALHSLGLLPSETEAPFIKGPREFRSIKRKIGS